MSVRTALIAFLSSIMLQSVAIAKDDAKLANLVFPSENQITESQLLRIGTSKLKEIIKSIELQPEDCLNHIKAHIDDNSLEDIQGVFKAFDFSGDGIEDLIFTSYCGGEELRNYFWIHKDNKYYYSGSTEGTLLKLIRTPGSTSYSVVTRGGWCCLGYIGFNNLYKPSMQDHVIKYYLAESIREFSQLTIPDKKTIFKRFVVKNDKYKLREHPIIDDKYDEYESDFERKPVYGNTLAEFSKGSKGLAIAEKPDETGRVWWFVIMDSDAKAEYSRFYGDPKESKAGWMSSRYLEIIN